MASSLQEDIENDELKLFDFAPKSLQVLSIILY